MPNHVRNVLKFRKLKPNERDLILETIASKVEDGRDYIIDFDKIIPEPQTLEDCPEDCRVNKDSHVQEDEDRPWFDWYTWRNKYWGTKWSAYDCYTEVGKTCITFVFSTAWSVPYPIIEQLRLLGYEFSLRYADEDLGSNCGRITYNREQGYCHYDESEVGDSYEFAERLWNTY